MFHQQTFWGHPISSDDGGRYAWEFHLTLECPAWQAPRRRLATADVFRGNLGQAMDHYLAMVAERGGRRLHFAVCRCMVGAAAPGTLPTLHGTVTIQLNP